MNSRTVCTPLAAVAFAVAAAGCNTPPPKQAGCPEGTVERNGECFAPESASESGGGGSSSSSSGSSSSSSSGSSSSGSSSSSSSSGSEPSSPGGKVPYDREMVDAKVKRAVEQVKKNCGAATEDDGKSVGPWGKATVTVTIAKNGRSRDATINAPFAGTAVGRCAANAFNGFQYPPFGAADQKLDVEVELVKPGTK